MRIAILASSRWAAQGVAAALAVEPWQPAVIDGLPPAGDDDAAALVWMAPAAPALQAAWSRLPLTLPLLLLDADDAAQRTIPATDTRPIGLLSAGAGDETLRAALHALLLGLQVRDGAWAWARPWAVPVAAPIEPLTAREVEVFELMARGLSNRDIGQALAISAHTAKFHVAQILDKTGAATRAEAVRLGLRWGLVGL